MLNTTDLKNGAVFMHEGNPYKVLNYAHIKMSRGGAVIKLKVVDILSGAIKDISLPNGGRVEEADFQNKNMQYLYSDGEDLYFMDPVDYSQVQIPVKNVESEAKFLVEGKEFLLMFYEGKPISITLPASLYLEVKEAEPATKGNTATNATKKITLENGLVVNAPLFIKVGDVVKINTTTGEYVERGTAR
jgi:elongation factor P